MSDLNLNREKKVSIIIRTKNEERWITSCLDMIFVQTYKNFEIILVDNCSEDKTICKAKNFNIHKIVTVTKYLPGNALNEGIKVSSGDYIVCISAHCIPVDKHWLSQLVDSLESDPSYAGVYGRQQPMSFSSPSDKRDLMLVFGLDEKVQVRDSFFHNANSILRRNLWEECPFEDEITNIEDRVWAQEMLNRGYKIFYQPNASVYHFHGIHQDGNQERLGNIIKIIENRGHGLVSGNLDPRTQNIVAIIPIKGKLLQYKNDYILKRTIHSLKCSKYISKIIVSTDNKETAKIAESLGAVCPFIREEHLSQSHINLDMVQQYSLQKLEEIGLYPDVIFHLEETFPFREENLIDEMIENFLVEGYDSLVASKEESGWIWKQDDFSLNRIDEGEIPSEYKNKCYIGAHGVGLITYPEVLRKGSLLGSNVGLFTIRDPKTFIEIKSKESFLFLET